MKKLLSVLLAVLLVMSLASLPAAAAEPKIARIAETWAYTSLDAHQGDPAWQTSPYGMSETLFRVDENLAVQPLLAKGYEVSEDGLTWTVTINEKAAFSNGKTLTADMAARNLQRLASVNTSFAYLGDYEYEAADEKTLVIKTAELVPTMISSLTSPETAMIDLDDTKDFDNDPIYTGPFVLKSFEPEGTVEVVRNEKYWNGKAKLDGAIFYHMSDEDSKVMAMQSGEIDGYVNVGAAAKEIFSLDPDTYTLTDNATTRLQFYCLNKNRLSDNVRKAINLAVDYDAISEFLSGTNTPAVGMFKTSAPYGKVTKPAADPAAAEAALKADGYTKNAKGFYEKDGKVLKLDIWLYNARSLDSIAVVMQQQLKAIGIDSEQHPVEDPDSTYVKTGDYDIALYCFIADKAGDPYYGINYLFRAGGTWSVGGFEDADVEAMIDELYKEPDVSRRAELANKIVQAVIDDNAFGFVGLINSVTVTANGLHDMGEHASMSYYRINADTDF